MSDYAALRAAAEAATPGPWAVATWGPVLTKAWVDYDADPNAPTPELWLCIAGQSPEDSAYIAAANPSVALALLDRLNAAEAERDRLAAALRAQAMRYDENGALCFCDTDCYPFDPHIEYCLIARAALEETKP